LFFAPWAWAYSTLHPLGVGRVPAIAGKVGYKAGTSRATLLGARHVPERLCGGLCLLGALYQVGPTRPFNHALRASIVIITSSRASPELVRSGFHEVLPVFSILNVFPC